MKFKTRNLPQVLALACVITAVAGFHSVEGMKEAEKSLEEKKIEGSVEAFRKLCKIYGVAEGGNINFNNNILNNQNINKIENELKAPVSYKTPASYILNAMCAILAAERQYFKVYKDLLKCWWVGA